MAPRPLVQLLLVFYAGVLAGIGLMAVIQHVHPVNNNQEDDA